MAKNCPINTIITYGVPDIKAAIKANKWQVYAAIDEIYDIVARKKAEKMAESSQETAEK